MAEYKLYGITRFDFGISPFNLKMSLSFQRQLSYWLTRVLVFRDTKLQSLGSFTLIAGDGVVRNDEEPFIPRFPNLRKCLDGNKPLNFDPLALCGPSGMLLNFLITLHSNR